MIGSSAGRRLTIVLPLALAVAALALLLSRPPATLGQVARAGCVPSTAHSTDGARACAARRHRTHARPKAKKHHTKHALAKKKKKAKNRPTAQPPAASTQQPAICEDGSGPVRGSDGSYSCEDGSEPACASGAEPTPSSDGSKLLCPVASGAGPATTPAICEDESVPLRAGDGSYSCDDGSEPECEGGSSPTVSSASTLVCVTPVATGPSSAPAEEFDSDGISMRVSSAS